MRLTGLMGAAWLASTGMALAQAKPAVPRAPPPPRAEAGLVLKPSGYGVKETVDRLAKAVEDKGAKVVARVDHAAGAKVAGAELKPSEVLIFGNPKLGTPLMQGNARAGLDLPLKMLAYEDAAGRVWLAYMAPAALQARYRIRGKDGEAAIKSMTAVLDDLAKAATVKP